MRRRLVNGTLATTVCAAAFLTVLATAGAANVIPMITNVETEAAGDTLRVTFDVDDPDGDEMTVLLRFAGLEGGLCGGDVSQVIKTGPHKFPRQEAVYPNVFKLDFRNI